MIEIMIFKKLRFQSVFRPRLNAKPVFSNSSCLKSVEETIRFVVTKTRNDPQRSTTTHNDPQRSTTIPQRPTTTHNDPTTTHNDLQMTEGDLKTTQNDPTTKETTQED